MFLLLFVLLRLDLRFDLPPTSILSISIDSLGILSIRILSVEDELIIIGDSFSIFLFFPWGPEQRRNGLAWDE